MCAMLASDRGCLACELAELPVKWSLWPRRPISICVVVLVAACGGGGSEPPASSCTQLSLTSNEIVSLFRLAKAGRTHSFHRVRGDAGLLPDESRDRDRGWFRARRRRSEYVEVGCPHSSAWQRHLRSGGAETRWLGQVRGVVTLLGDGEVRTAIRYGGWLDHGSVFAYLTGYEDASVPDSPSAFEWSIGEATESLPVRGGRPHGLGRW